MVEFRKEFPMQELMALVSHFRGEKKLPIATLINYLFEVVSYGLGQVLPDPENKRYSTGWDVTSVTPEELADALESTLPNQVQATMSAEPGTVKKAIPWQMIIPVLANVISDILLKYLRGEVD